LLCALALFTAPAIRAADTPAQAAARAALEAKIKELDANSPAVTPSPTPAPAPTASTGAIEVTPAGATVPAEKPTAADNAAQARAREALLKELHQPPPNESVAALEIKPVAATKAKPAKKPAPAVKVENSGKELGLKPITAPALPIAASKEGKLQALLAKYKADQISPEEYHRQRAEVLAAP
jgi:hypothetical protein